MACDELLSMIFISMAKFDGWSALGGVSMITGLVINLLVYGFVHMMD